MNSAPPRQDSAIDERAAYWAARLEGDVLEAGERAALDAWLAQAPAHRAALSGYCQFSADLEEQLPRLVAAGAVALPPPARRAWTFPRFAGLALAAAASVMLAVWFYQPAPAVEDIASAVARRTAHTLGDGTRVELNANTSLRFENSASERRVRLADGEAIFQVTKDPSRPFIVETPVGSVRVTGTTFNVRAEPAGAAFEVTVVEGSVEVRPGAVTGARADESPVALGAGEQLLAQVGGVSLKTLPPAALEDALAWRRGLAVFNDVPLGEAAARFARYHGRRIAVNPAIVGERIGGHYSLEDLSGFLKGMESALGLDLKFDQNGATFLGPRQAP